MYHFIILSIMCVLFIYLTYYFSEDNGIESLISFILSLIFICWLLGHSIEWVSASHDYEILKAEVETYQETLDNIRDTENNFERGTIAESILKLNVIINNNKIQNKTWFFDVYIDDRIDSLKFIK